MECEGEWYVGGGRFFCIVIMWVFAKHQETTVDLQFASFVRCFVEEPSAKIIEHHGPRSELLGESPSRPHSGGGLQRLARLPGPGSTAVPCIEGAVAVQAGMTRTGQNTQPKHMGT